MGRVSAVAAGTALIVVATVCCDAADTASARVELIDGEVANPGQVTDLQAIANTEKAVLLAWTEVDDGTGDPARYAVRYASPEMTSWSAAHPTEVSVDGSQIGTALEVELNGLEQGTEYEFRLVAYRGTLNEDAEFGNLSNSTKIQTDGGSTGDDSGADDSGGTSDGGSSSVQPLFYDGFESGDHSHRENGYSWNQTSGRADHVSDGTPVRAGEWASRFRQHTPNNRLLRISGPALSEFWFEYWIRIPGPDGAPEGEGAEYCHSDDTGGNNKWAEFFHNRSELYVISEMWPTGDCESRQTWITNGEGHHTLVNPAIKVSQDVSEWKRWSYHVKYTTLSSTSVRVEYQGWIDGNKAWSVERTIEGVDEQFHRASYFQIMGWNNAFDERITWYVDEVRLYDQDPGW